MTGVRWTECRPSELLEISSARKSRRRSGTWVGVGMNTTVNGVPHRDLRLAVGREEQDMAAQMLGVGMDLTRIDVSRNARRFYRMEIWPGLFGEWSLVCEWGRIGQSGQVRVDWFDTEAAAKDARFNIQMQKTKRGYA